MSNSDVTSKPKRLMIVYKKRPVCHSIHVNCTNAPWVTISKITGPVLFCTLSSVGIVCLLSSSSVRVICNVRERSAAVGPGTWRVRRPTLHGRTVRLRPIQYIALKMSFYQFTSGKAQLHLPISKPPRTIPLQYRADTLYGQSAS